MTNRPRLLGVVAYTQKRYSVLLGGATQMDESAWRKGEQRVETPRVANWFCVKKHLSRTVYFEVQGSNHLHVESYPHHRTASPCLSLFRAGKCHNFGAKYKRLWNLRLSWRWPSRVQVFVDVKPYSSVEMYQRFGENCCLMFIIVEVDLG